MAGTTVRIAEATRDKLRDIANRENTSMHIILEKAIEDYRRKCFLDEANRAYETLRQDHNAWQEEQSEREWE